MLRYPFVSQEIPVGTYEVIGTALDDDNTYLIIKRGGKVTLAQVPTNILMCSTASGPVFEIKEGGGFRTPTLRGEYGNELETIRNWRPPGPTPRG